MCQLKIPPGRLVGTLVKPGIKIAIEANARGHSRLLVDGSDVSLGDAPRDKKLIGYLLNAKVCGEEKAAHLRLSGGKAELLNISIESLLARRAGRPRKAAAKRHTILPPPGPSRRPRQCHEEGPEGR